MGKNRLDVLLLLLLVRMASMEFIATRKNGTGSASWNSSGASDGSLTDQTSRPVPFISLLRETLMADTGEATTEQNSTSAEISVSESTGNPDKLSASKTRLQEVSSPTTPSYFPADMRESNILPLHTKDTNTSSTPSAKTRSADSQYTEVDVRYRRSLSFDYPFNGPEPDSESGSEPWVGQPEYRDVVLGEDELRFLSEFQEWCQQQKRCDGTELDSLPTGEVCRKCSSCSCANECNTDSNCCLDKLIWHARSEIEQKNPHCHSSVYVNTPYDADYILSGIYHNYVMENTCQEGWSNDSVREKCVNASGTDIQSQWPVWSAGSGLTYRNKHCALCNGQIEDQLQQWDLSFVCNVSLVLEPSPSLEDAVREVLSTSECRLVFIPPNESRYEQCRPTVYTKNDGVCPVNATYWNRTSSETFAKICDAFFDETPVSVQPTRSNLFCGLCLLRLTVCESGSIDTPFPFVLVMSAKALRNVTSATGSTCQCALDEIYDKYESRCRKLQCSLPKRLHNGRCAHWVKRSQGVGYLLSLRLTSSDFGVPILYTDIQSFIDIVWEIFSAFKQHFLSYRFFAVRAFRTTYHVEKCVKLETWNAVTRKCRVKSIDLKIKMIIQYLTDTQQAENDLLRLTHSIWNFSIDAVQDPMPFHLNIMNSVETDIMNPPKSRYEIQPDEVLTYTKDYSEYSIDIADFIGEFRTPTSPSAVTYHFVQDTLHCPKVSFTVSSEETTASSDLLASERNSSGLHPPSANYGHLLHSVSADTGEVILSVDPETGTAYHHPSRHNISFQYVELLQDGVVLVCAEQLYGTHTISSGPLVLHKFFSTSMIYVSVACQSLSVLCLFLVFFTYCLFAELRTLPGKNTMGLVASLLIAMLLFEVGVARVETPVVCLIVGVVIHLSLLSAFTWMVLCSTCMYRIFTRLLVSRHDQAAPQASLFRKYVTLSVLVPVLIVTLTLLGNWLAHRRDCDLDLGYGRGICYLSNTWSLILASVLPICVAVVINMVLFLCTLYSLRSTSQAVRLATRTEHHHLVIYVRLSTLTGINWLAGLLTAVVDSVIMWYIFIVLCGLQGLYVFVAFVCSQRVVSLYRGLFDCRQRKHGRADDTQNQGQPSPHVASSAGVRSISMKTDID